MKTWVFYLCLIVLFSGCAVENQSLQSGNPNLATENIELVKVGQTTKEVLEIMGTPDETLLGEQGEVEWLYRGSEGQWTRPSSFSRKTTNLKAKVLSVKINTSGKVTHVDYDELETTNTKPF